MGQSSQPSASPPRAEAIYSTRLNPQEGGYNYAQTGRRKNTIINGNFDIWQRETGFVAVSSTGTYTADQWVARDDTSGSANVTRTSNAVPTFAEAGVNVQYALVIECTSTDTPSGAEYMTLYQPIEGTDWAALSQRPTVLSFMVKSNKTGVYCVDLMVEGPGSNEQHCVKEYEIIQSNTWEKKILYFDPNPSNGGQFGNDLAARLFFVLAAGSDLVTDVVDSWEEAAAGNFLAVSENQVNFMDSTNNDFWITGVQLEPGRIATEFEQISFFDNLQRCARYYQKSYNRVVVPGTATSTGAILERVNAAGQTTLTMLNARLSPPMRTTPTVTFYSTITGTANRVRDIVAGADRVVDTISDTGETQTGWPTLAIGITNADTNARAHWTAEATL